MFEAREEIYVKFMQVVRTNKHVCMFQVSLETSVESANQQPGIEKSVTDGIVSKSIHLHSHRTSFSTSADLPSTSVCLGTLTDTKFSLLTNIMSDLHTLPRSASSKEKYRDRFRYIESPASKLLSLEMTNSGSCSNLRCDKVSHIGCRVSSNGDWKSYDQLPTVTARIENSQKVNEIYSQDKKYKYELKRTVSGPSHLIENENYTSYNELETQQKFPILSKTILTQTDRKVQTILSNQSGRKNNNESSILPQYFSSSISSICRPPRKPPRADEFPTICLQASCNNFGKNKDIQAGMIVNNSSNFFSHILNNDFSDNQTQSNPCTEISRNNTYNIPNDYIPIAIVNHDINSSACSNNSASESKHQNCCIRPVETKTFSPMLKADNYNSSAAFGCTELLPEEPSKNIASIILLEDIAASNIIPPPTEFKLLETYD